MNWITFEGKFATENPGIFLELLEQVLSQTKTPLILLNQRWTCIIKFHGFVPFRQHHQVQCFLLPCPQILLPSALQVHCENKTKDSF